MAPDLSYGELLGLSIYFYTKDVGKPVCFFAPSFATDVQRSVPRYRDFKTKEHGCKLWWVEYGGRLDTVHDTEKIKWKLWEVVYGIWDYIKNSGKFPEAANYTLEWVGMIPGKRESRRFEGDYILSQSDIVEQKNHNDAVAYGGWSIDLHPADGVFSEKPPCNQWHSKGIFQIPYRCLYSRNISNLFLAGRIISVSHVAFGATRVMATCAYVGQAVAVAAAFCIKRKTTPAELYSDGSMTALQNELLRTGQFIPKMRLNDSEDLLQQSTLAASSSLRFSGFNEEGYLLKTLSVSAGQLLPLGSGRVPILKIRVMALSKTVLKASLRISSRYGSFTPDITLSNLDIVVEPGVNYIELDFDVEIYKEQYVFVCFLANEQIQLAYSLQRITGMLSVFNGTNKAVSNNGKQAAPDGSAVDSFEFWCPERRPKGQNIALQLNTVLSFEIGNIKNGVDRPTTKPNAWVADTNDKKPFITIQWDEPQLIKKMHLTFDTDTDHPMESVLMTHPETVMPFCVRNYYVEDGSGNRVYQKNNNFQIQLSLKYSK